MRNLRLGSWALVHCLIAAALAANCGGSTSSTALGNSGIGGIGEAGANGNPRGGRGGSSGAATAGRSPGGVSGNAGAADGGYQEEGGSDCCIAPPPEGGAENAAGAGGTAGDGGEGGAVEQEPPLDVGAGCLPPTSAPKLTPAAAGLPANGLTLWLRGNRGVYATDQHRVCAWVDQSPNQFVFLASNGSRPLWAADNLGTKAGIDFDSSTSALSVSGVLGIPATSGRTFIAVVQSVDTTGRFAAIQQGQSGTPGTYLAIDSNTFNTAGSLEGVYICNNSYDSAMATSRAPRVHVYTVNTMAPGQPVLANIDYRVNGATQTLTRNGGGLGNGNIEDFANANFSLVGGGAHAIIAEALIYDRALTVAERSTIETALQARYAIQ